MKMNDTDEPRRGADAAGHDDSLPTSPAALFSLFDALNISHVTVSHPPLHTVEESKQLRGDIPGAHIKNLFLKDKKGRLFLVTALESSLIDLKTLHGHVGGTGRLSFCNADQLWQHLGVRPGAVTPFALINDRDRAVSFVLDRALSRFDRLNAHPLVNTMTTGVSRDGLLALLAHSGHSALELDLTALASLPA
jgi:Ala-tRNA(Pro) deacylase